MIVRLPGLGRLLQGAGSAPRDFAGPAQVRAYWEGLRQGGGIPDRMALDPRGMGGALDRVFLAERIGRGLVQVRIAGSALAEAAGMDLRGLPLSCLFRPEARPVLAEVLEAVTQGAAISGLDLSCGGAQPVARLLLLPLIDGPERRLVLGCLGLDAGRVAPGAGFAILRRQDERIDPPPAQHRAPAPPPAPRRVGHLTLVHGME